MPVKPIRIFPDPILRQKSKSIGNVDSDIKALAHDMLETMYAAPGIGLAAVQIGIPLRMFVIDISKDNEPKAPQIFINPEIIKISEEFSFHEEGCLSIPDCCAELGRPSSVHLRFIDERKQKNEIIADGLLAICLQHEMDHLDGILFIDRISKLKQDIIIRKLRKRARKTSQIISS